MRREVQEADRTSLDAAQEITRIVLDVFGLQPVAPPETEWYELTPDDLGVVAYQVVLAQ